MDNVLMLDANSETTHLVNRPPDDPLAYVGEALPWLDVQPGRVTVTNYLTHVKRLAERMPSACYVINLCQNRYALMVAFGAACLLRKTTLLPPNKAAAVQHKLAARYPNTVILHDGLDALNDLHYLDIRSGRQSGALSTEYLSSANIEVMDDDFQVPLSFTAAISFTSGSTGDPKPNIKTWHALVESTRMNARYMLPKLMEPNVDLLATVPGQHMWGFEASILFALQCRVCVSDAKPLFPKDIATRLAQLKAPRILVSTPVHLRAMSLSGQAFPGVERILCATAPLSLAQASEAERLFSAELVEVYGCSEIGSMAWRNTARSDLWQRFDGIAFESSGSESSGHESSISESIIASAGYFPSSVLLSDRIALLEHDYFQLLGRNKDMIKIAGKRGSLQEMNQILLSMDGVRDGVVIQPKEGDKNNTVIRLKALVAASSDVSKKHVLKHFALHVDPAFVPRTICFVESLPREENGKLSQAKLNKLWTQLEHASGT